MEEIDKNMWREIEKAILKIGNQNTARKIRHLYMVNISDDDFERIYTIACVQIRQAMNAVYDKFDVDPEVLREVPKSPSKPRRPNLGSKGPVSKNKPNLKKLGAVGNYEIMVEDE